MTYNLSQLLRDVLGELGRTETFVATGGSQTTAANSKYADRNEPPTTDFANEFGLFVVKDTAGLAPEDEFAAITAYNAGTYTFTFDSLTAAVASGDEILIADKRFPLREMIRLANRAVQKFEVPLTDTSLTTAAAQTEYSLPVAYKQEWPLLVEYQGKTGDADDNRRIPVNPVKVVPSAAGSVATLIIPQLPAGRTLYITGITAHPALTTYSSAIREEIHPELAIAATAYQALLWYSGQQDGRSDYWEKRLNLAAKHLEDMRVAHPIAGQKRNANRIPMWSLQDDDPGVPSPIYQG